MTEINYSHRDFSTIRGDMLARAARLIPEWTAGSSDDFGVALIESFAYMGDMMSYYIDRVLNEGLIEYAVLPSSVRSLALLAGYVPNAMVAAEGTVTITLTPGAAETTIPAGTELIADLALDTAPVVFTTDSAVTLGGANPEYDDVTVTQGSEVTDEALGSSTGRADQQYSITEVNVVTSTLDVFVGSVRWTLVDSFADAGPNNRYFVAEVDSDRRTTIRFGDGAAGAIPPTNAAITVSYRTANGSEGNVAAGAISAFVSPPSTVASVTNALACSGGAWDDTTTDIRREVRLGSRTVLRAVTQDDFASLALEVPGVLFASAYSTNYSTVTVYVVPTGGGTPTSALLSAVETYLEERALVGTDVVAAAPTYVPLNITGSVYVNASYAQADVTAAATDAVEEAFALGQIELGADAYASQVWSAVLAVEGVDYLTLSLFARDDAAQSGIDTQAYAVGELATLGTLTLSAVGGL